MTSYLPLPSEMGQLALNALRDELIPTLPSSQRYQGLMVAKAIEYALTQADEARRAGAQKAQDLVDDVTANVQTLDAAFWTRLEQFIADELAKVTSAPDDPVRSNP